MSNTSSVTPFDASPIIETCAVAVRWLTETSTQDQAAIDRVREERRTSLLAPRSQTRLNPIQSVGLHLRDAAALVRTAEASGYRVSRPTTEGPYLLTGSRGQRLVLARNAAGKVLVHTASGREPVEQLVRQYVTQRTTEHLLAAGMRVSAVERRGGTEFRASGAHSRLTANVDTSGRVAVDVEDRGPQCRKTVEDLAAAVGGVVASFAPKPAYFQLPGEPTRTAVRIK